MGSQKMGYIASQDIHWHDTAVGYAQQTFTRAKQGGGSKSGMIRPSAANVPLRDTPFTSGSPGPFENLSSKDANEALRHIMARKRDAWNFQAEGGVPNDSSSATAKQNREVWDRYIAAQLLATRVQPIYFPPGTWYFERPVADTGSNVLPVYDYSAGTPATPGGMTIIGEEAVLAATPAVGFTENLMRTIGAVDFNVADVRFSLITSSYTGSCLLMDGASDLIKLLRCRYVFGNHGVKFGANGTLVCRNIWLELCEFLSQQDRNIIGTNLEESWINRNQLKGTLAANGIKFQVTGATERIKSVYFDGNLVDYGDVTFIGQGTVANQRDVFILRQRLENGQISVQQFDRPRLFDCHVEQGGIAVTFTSTPSTGFWRGPAIIACTAQQAGTASGLSIITANAGGTNIPVYGLLIDGGEYFNNDYHGIHLSASGANGEIRGGIITGLLAKNNSQAGAGTYDGVRMDSAGGALIHGVKVTENDLIDDQGTPTQDYGVREVGAGSDFNRIGGNYMKGNVTAPWGAVGADTLLTPANVEE